MLARLTMLATSPRILDLQIQPISRLSSEESEHTSTLIVDLEAFKQAFLPSIPNNPWNRVAAACGRALAPVCTGIQSTFSNDIDTIAQLLYNLEVGHDAEESLEKILPVGLLEPATVVDDGETAPLSLSMPNDMELGRASNTCQTYQASQPSCLLIPLIVITPAPSQNRETSSLVPYQDEAFGKQLTVPLHPAFNKRYPPMQTLQLAALPRLDTWKWVNGHWTAVIPSLEEQTRRGMFSRPRGTRRKHNRHLKKQRAQAP